MPCFGAKSIILCRINSETRNHSENDKRTRKNSFSYIYRRKTKCELLRLSLSMMGTEIVYSVLTAFASPLLLKYGQKPEFATLVWAIASVFGLFFGPVLGFASDRCKLSIGRRRPFIVILSILDVIGLILVANCYNIGKKFGDTKNEIFFTNQNVSLQTEMFGFQVEESKIEENKTHEYYWTVIIIFIGTVLVDFSSDTLLNPCRAYALDICIAEDHDKVLIIGSVLSGIGGFVGYAVGSIDWKTTVFSIYADELISDNTQVIFYIVTILFIICILLTITTFNEIPLKNSIIESQIDKNSSNKNEVFVGLKAYLKSVISMPYALKILCLTNLFSWVPHLNFSLYFTHFVGNSVFQGNPLTASSESGLYETGIRFACITLSMHSIIYILYSIVSGKLINLFGLKYVYVGALFLTSLSFLATMLVQHNVCLIFVSVMNGILECSLFTIPYLLVAQYHVKNLFPDDKVKQSFHERGLGTDMAIVNTSLCVAQLVTSIWMGKLMAIFGTPFAVMGTSALSGFIAAIIATKIVCLDSK